MSISEAMDIVRRRRRPLEGGAVPRQKNHAFRSRGRRDAPFDEDVPDDGADERSPDSVFEGLPEELNVRHPRFDVDALQWFYVRAAGQVELDAVPVRRCMGPVPDVELRTTHMDFLPDNS